MKILHVMPYSPLPPNYGAKLRIYNLMKHLSRNHEVSVAFIGSTAEAVGLRYEFGGQLAKIIACPRHLTSRIRGAAPLRSFLGRHSILYHFGANGVLRSRVIKEVASGSYDVVLTEFPHMAFFDLPPGPLRVLDGHNIEFDNFQRMAERSETWFERLVARNEAKKYRAEEIEAFRRQDLLLFTSERDRQMAHEVVPGVPSVVVPNGVDPSYFRPTDTSPDRRSIVFTGIMDYLPNADGAAWFLDEIFPLILAKEPRAKVTIVGADPGRRLLRLASSNVRFTGYVDDVRPYVHKAAVSVVPLRMGGGTRLKIIESLGMMTPVVSTPIGAEGLDLVHGEHALIAAGPQEFADAVLGIFADPGLSEKLSRNGLRLVEDRYEWSVIGSALEKKLREAIDSPDTRKGRHVR